MKQNIRQMCSHETVPKISYLKLFFFFLLVDKPLIELGTKYMNYWFLLKHLVILNCLQVRQHSGMMLLTCGTHFL